MFCISGSGSVNDNIMIITPGGGQKRQQSILRTAIRAAACNQATLSFKHPTPGHSRDDRSAGIEGFSGGATAPLYSISIYSAHLSQSVATVL